jgi:hypothetical protein
VFINPSGKTYENHQMLVTSILRYKISKSFMFWLSLEVSRKYSLKQDEARILKPIAQPSA